jgi:hypothetical protein
MLAIVTNAGAPRGASTAPWHGAQFNAESRSPAFRSPDSWPSADEAAAASMSALQAVERAYMSSTLQLAFIYS